MKGFRCPSCGTALPGRPDPHKLIEHLSLGYVQRALLRTLLANFARQVPTEVLADRLYSCARGGGPLTAHKCISVHAYHLRKKLKQYGLTIVGNPGSARFEGGAYRLDWMDAPAVKSGEPGE